jgi:Recombination endonuclease VII
MKYPTYPPTLWCELCGKAPPNNRAGHARLHADHDHSTGEFRGWLCRVCNVSLGALGDNEAGLLRAVTYIRRYK